MVKILYRFCTRQHVIIRHDKHLMRSLLVTTDDVNLRKNVFILRGNDCGQYNTQIRHATFEGKKVKIAQITYIKEIKSQKYILVLKK